MRLLSLKTAVGGARAGHEAPRPQGANLGGAHGIAPTGIPASVMQYGSMRCVALSSSA
jgi:hypothetical protein